MFCGHCGDKLQQGAHFCEKCGSRSQAQSTSSSTTTHFGQFGGQQASQPQQQYQAPAYSGENSMAIAGLICAFMIPLLGLIFSILGLQKAKEMNGKGRTMSLWGLWLSIIYIVLTVVYVVIYIIIMIWVMEMGDPYY